MDIKGRIVLVTGASRGIGVTIARELARRGGRIAVTARSEEALRKVADSIGAVAVPADVSSAEDRERLLKTVESELGPLDVLVNNAGIESIRAFAEMPEQDIRDIVEVNLVSPMLLTRAALPGMLDRGRGLRHLAAGHGGGGEQEPRDRDVPRGAGAPEGRGPVPDRLALSPRGSREATRSETACPIPDRSSPRSIRCAPRPGSSRWR